VGGGRGELNKCVDSILEFGHMKTECLKNLGLICKTTPPHPKFSGVVSFISIFLWLEIGANKLQKSIPIVSPRADLKVINSKLHEEKEEITKPPTR
jgi:hypothetical protein